MKFHIPASHLNFNHGSFGAVPSKLFKKYVSLVKNAEKAPTDFFERQLRPLFVKATQATASLMDAPFEDIAFVPNASTGVNTVVRSMSWNKGDEILMPYGEYQPLRPLWTYLEKTYGVVLKFVPLGLNASKEGAFDGFESFIKAFEKSISPQTKLLFASHIPSALGCVLPVEKICAFGLKHKIPTLIDGAHAPGQIEVSIKKLRPTFYTGNLHKWVNTPKSAAFLYVDPDNHDIILPPTLSVGYQDPFEGLNRFQSSFAWMGTWDYFPFLMTPEALRILGAYKKEGLKPYQNHGHRMAIDLARRIQKITKLPQPIPLESPYFAMMASVPLPPGPSKDFRQKLWKKHKLEVLIEYYPDRIDGLPSETIPKEISPLSHSGERTRFLRVSGQLYNTPEQVKRAARILGEYLG